MSFSGIYLTIFCNCVTQFSWISSACITWGDKDYDRDIGRKLNFSKFDKCVAPNKGMLEGKNHLKRAARLLGTLE